MSRGTSGASDFGDHLFANSGKKGGGADRGVSLESCMSYMSGGSCEDMRQYSEPLAGPAAARRPWEVLTPFDIRARQAAATEEAMEMLGLEPDVAQFLLRCYKWNGSALSEHWFDRGGETVLKKFKLPKYMAEGAPDAPMSPRDKSALFFDTISCEEVPYSQTTALPCGHRFSDGCWEGYLKCALGEGPEVALNKRCPMDKCGDLVRSGVWLKYLQASVKDKQKFEDYVMRSYVEQGDPQRIRWCPGKGCQNAVELKSKETDVACSCGHRFCMLCGDEAHVPVPCEILKRWNEKNKSEGGNADWLLVNTKPCPKCRYPIEKNMGCMHMTCRCGHHFCWICLGDWGGHTNFYACNRFQEAAQDPKMAAEEARKQRAKDMLDRYVWHFERYQAHHHAQKVAQEKTLKQFEERAETLHAILGESQDLEFFPQAVKQIIECRRMLKWSYAFLFFATFAADKKEFFVFQQGQLEHYLNLLQEAAETTDVNKLLEGNSYQPFYDFKTQLTNKTRVVQDFFSKMGEAFATEFNFFEEGDLNTGGNKASGSGASSSGSKR